MARINIESRFLLDPRFIDLAILFQDREKAIGHCFFAWLLAQGYWLDNKKLIPSSEWEKFIKTDALFKVGLAIKTESGVYVCGTKEEAAWLLQRSEAGKSSGISRKKSSLNLIQDDTNDA